ncbi:extracellular solute-binding protein [Paenibacillus sp. GCM10028914]|uniref:extracellular solute-binding protein n=1 Tax=Paenibacillus sp. GCM10028914 TaxID=3273416 RepID=UPI0036196A38
MKKRKALLLMITALFLLTTVLAGCTKSASSPEKEQNSSTPNSSNTDKKPEDEKPADIWEFGSSELNLTAFTHYSWQDFPEKMEDAPLWKYLKENKKVNITSILASGNNDQLVATMMADNKLPDLMYGDRNHRDFLKLIKAGKLVALDDYMEKYPNLKKWLSSEAADLLRSPDGKLYQFPNYYTKTPNGSAGYVVNKKIYKELGSPPLETMDDLYDYLVKVKEKYGDEVVPFDPERALDAQGVGMLYTGFQENAYYRSLNSNTLAVIDYDNNKLASLFTDPTFRESQKFVSKLYREKLINQDMFTTTRELVHERVMNGKVAIFAGASPMAVSSRADANLSKEDPDAGYFVTWPIHKAGLDKNKIFPGSYDQLGWNVSVITTAAKEPEKIFAFLDWMTGPEGMTTTYYGPEGLYWEGLDENDQPIFTDAYDAIKVSEFESANDRVIIAANAGYIDPVKKKYESDKPFEKKGWSTRYQESVTWKTHNDHTALGTNLTPDAGTELADISVNIIDVYQQALSASGTAKSDEDVDRILDKAEADAVALGYNELLEWRTEQWLKNKELLGIE